MGYRRKIYTLTWAEGHDLHGLEVSLTGLSVGRIAKLAGLAAKLTSDIPVDERLGDAHELFHEMAACLIEWNLEDHKGRPVPAKYLVCIESGQPEEMVERADTAIPSGRCKEHANCPAKCEFDGIVNQDVMFVVDLALTWMEAVASVGNPLPPASSDTPNTALEESIPMTAPLSPSPPS